MKFNRIYLQLRKIIILPAVMCVKQNTGGFFLHLFEYALLWCTIIFVWNNARLLLSCSASRRRRRMPNRTWTTLLMTICLLSEFHLQISQTESATTNRHILPFSIQGKKTQSFPKSVRVIRDDVTFSCSFEHAVPSMWVSDGVSSVRDSLIS
jgi:hypothetical protein